jgi:hypothetical protein
MWIPDISADLCWPKVCGHGVARMGYSPGDDLSRASYAITAQLDFFNDKFRNDI